MSCEIWTCPEHGVEYGSVCNGSRTTWACPKCERAAQRAQRKFEYAHWCYRWWDRSSGVPARYRAATAASILPVTASAKVLARAVEGYTSDLQTRFDAGAGLLLIGPPGLGKTLALCAVVNAACDWARGPIYASWPDLLAQVKAGFNGAKDDPRRQAIDRLQDAPFLALDELGVRGMTEWEHGELFRLVDHRYSQQLPTLVAANATPSNFPTLVGERVADRLLETCALISLDGNSLRGKFAITGPDAMQPPAASVSVRVHTQGAWRDRTIEAPCEGRLRA